MSWTYVDGSFKRSSGARVLAGDQGLLFGRGVFETFLATLGKRVFLLDRHVARMRAGALLLGITPPAYVENLEESVQALLSRNRLQAGRVRATLTAGPDGGSPSLVIQAQSSTGYEEAMYRDGVGVIVAEVRRNESSPLSRAKSLNYLDNILAREDARSQGAMEALLLNTKGVLAEGSASNVFLIAGGEVITPRIADGALPGVTRQAVLEIAAARSLVTQERRVTPEELMGADEVFLTSAVAGVLPVRKIGGRVVGAGQPGEMTRELRCQLMQMRDTPPAQ